MTANRRIFLNIVATYGRSLYALAIGLFCGRWTLMALGQTDYGLMGVVGGLTVYISYVNGILGGAIGRYYAIAVGKSQKDYEAGLEECRMWFTTSVVIHSIIPALLIIIGYPLGMYTIMHWLVIPPDRLEACRWVWRFVCVSCFLGMVSVPFNAMYSAKQYIAELTIYSFVTTTLNAIFLYYMVSHPGVWMTKYAFWQCLLGILPKIIIAVRAYYIFPECRIIKKYLNCWHNIKQISGYAFWTSWGAFGAMLRDNGQAILINRNYGPRVNAGVAIGMSLSGHCNSLSGSLIGAFNPAICNEWGAGNFAKARSLAFQACKFGTLLILLFALPLSIEVQEVLRLWLKNPPQYASGICVFVISMTVINKLATGHLIAVCANGKVAMYQAFLGTMLVATLPVAWAFMRFGMGPYSIGWAMVLTMFFCVIGRVWFARHLVGMSARYWVRRVAWPILVLIMICLIIGVIPRFIMPPSFVRVCATTILVEMCMIPLSWYFVLDQEERKYLFEHICALKKRMGW